MTKLVSLSDPAYRTLQKMKGKNMSFSDVVLKLADAASPKRDFLKFAGVLKRHARELEKLKAQIAEDRERNTDVS
ncbi:MAG: antitoxin VapB family protein [Candidatus Marsarchaeota archaeon]|nr:antitoxin VapB family protein [Candidatus Marsarchaeota archaeon]MCL5111299.1 antitoxin VapB family protein [Candidatus Marsarchaeota archaeon]